MIKLSRRLSVALLAMLCMPVVSVAAAEEYPNRPISMVDRDIRPVGTGTWSLPPFPHAEPNFRKLALEKKGFTKLPQGNDQFLKVHLSIRHGSENIGKGEMQ